MLPANFWEEFDRRLDARLDARLDVRLQPIVERLDNITERLVHIEGWTKRQDKGIEYEMTRAVQDYLEEAHRGYITVKPTVFPKDIAKQDGTTLTEFDGLLILTNDKEHANSLSKHLPKSGSISPNTSAYIVIVEAKQHVTTTKIKSKIRQKEAILKLVDDIQKGIMPLPRILTSVGIQYVKGVFLYIGGIEIDDKGRELMMDYCTRDPMSGLIEMTGSRFAIGNAFGQQQFGGGRKKRCCKTRFCT